MCDCQKITCIECLSVLDLNMTMATNHFVKIVKKEPEKSMDAKLKQLIKDAREAKSSEFIDSCERFLKTNGFLSPKQIDVLQNIAAAEYEDEEVSDTYDRFH